MKTLKNLNSSWQSWIAHGWLPKAFAVTASPKVISFGSLVCPTQMWTLWVGCWSCPLNHLQLCRYITEAPGSAAVQRQGHIQLQLFLCRPQILEAGLPSLPASNSTNPPAHLPGSHYPVTPAADTTRFALKTLQLIIACNYEKLRGKPWNAYQRGDG